MSARRSPLQRVYFDASGAMRYLVSTRRGHLVARAVWEHGDEVVSVALTYVEVRAALAAGRRSRAWGASGFQRLKQAWELAWREVDEVGVDRSLIALAGDVAEAEGLRGFDALQLTAARLSGCDLFVAADRRLCDAARRNRLRVVDLDAQ